MMIAGLNELETIWVIIAFSRAVP